MYRGFKSGRKFGRFFDSHKQTSVMNSSLLVVLSLVLLVWSTCTSSLPFTGSCDSCGRECQSACGTRGFRTCCLNYLKKRSTPTSAGSEMKLELMMVLPELARHYSPLASFLPDAPDRNQLLFEQLETGEEKNSEPK